MANVIVVSETPQRVIIRDEAATRTVKVVAQGPQGPPGNVNPLMFQMLDQATSAATSASADAAAAQTSSASAFASSNSAQASANAAMASEQAAALSAAGIDAKVTAAEASATSANTSATNAAASATSAAGSAASAQASANAVIDKANIADAAAASATLSAATATTKSSEAATSATNSASSAASAASSAATATTKASEASTSATNSATSATLAQDWAIKTAAPVSGSEYSSKYHALAAASHAANASGSAASAAASSAAASTKATEAATSATSAQSSATAASGSATSAGNSATAANASQSAAATSATNAANSATAASNSATSAAGSATSAGNSATGASSSAVSAAGSASTATTKAGEAATSATNAATSATQAASSAASALQAKSDAIAALDTKLDVNAAQFGGNAASATKLATARTLTVGSTGKAFDGTANVGFTLTEIGAAAAAHAHAITDINALALPDIKPSLLLDFANTKRLDSRITFTRASTATYWDGKTFAKAEENLLKYSQDFSNEVWTKLTGVGATQTITQNHATAPDGTMTATRVQMALGGAGSYSEIQRGFTPRAGEQYTYSIYLKSLSGTPVVDLGCYNNIYAQNKVTVTTEWVRYTFTWTATASVNAPGLLLYTVSSTANSADILVWGAQLEQRSQATAYTPTTDQTITKYQPVLQTAKSSAARFDHNPVTGESLGLLIEGQRANLLLQSQQLDAAGWTRSYMSVLANSGVAPDGSMSADLLVGGTSHDAKSTYQAPTVSSGVSYTFSVYAKAAGVNYAILRYQAVNFPSVAIRFSLTDGTTSPVSEYTAPTSSDAKYVGGGWYRLTITSTATGSGLCYPTVSLSKDTASYAYTGDGYSGIYIWGAQLEAGAFPTSYIPTTTAQVTRAADAAVMTGTNFSSWYRQDEGTTFIDAAAGPGGSYGLSISDGTGNNYIIGGRYAAGGAAAVVTAAGSIQANIGSSVLNARVSLAYRVNDFAVSTNGDVAVTDTAGNVPGVNRVQIGASMDGGIPINGTIKKIAYYPKRLSNTELQALTA